MNDKYHSWHREHIGFSAARFTSSLAVFPNCLIVFVPWGSVQLYFVGDRLRLGYFVLAWQAPGSDFRSVLNVTCFRL